jgi:ABC-type bacteriocin/lantibiotic exporter with double-glycine peptidase domain
MDGKPQKEFKKNDYISLLEKFTEILGIHFDSIHALSELEVFRRKQASDSVLDSFEELSFLGKKFGIHFEKKKHPVSEILNSISYSSPVAIQIKEKGWIILLSSFGPFIRIMEVSGSNSRWILKKTFVKMISSYETNSDLPEWILLDHNFFLIGNQHPSHQNYLESILQFIQIERKDIWAIAIYSVAIGLLSLTIPIGVQSLVTILNFGTLFQPVLVLTLLVTIALSFVGIMNVIQSYIAELIQQRLFVRLAAKVTNLFPKAKHSELQKYYGSEIPNYFLDIAIIQKSAVILITDALGIFLQTLIGLLVLVIYHPIFIIFDIVLIVVVIGIIFYLIGKVGIETSMKESKSKHKLASWLEEMNLHKTVFRSEKAHIYSNLRTENLAREYIQSRRKHFKALMRQMIGFVTLQAFGSGLLLGIGGWLVIAGKITLGQLVASEIIVAKILDNLSKFSKYLESYYDLCASVDKVNHLLDFSKEVSGTESVLFSKEIPISVNIQNLRTKVGEVAFSGLNLSAGKGEIVVMKEEAMKNSPALLDLLFGLYPTTHGAIEVNSYHLQDIAIAEWRNHVCLLRDLEVFSGSIADNIKLAKMESDSSEIRDILEKVGLMNRIQEFPTGIHAEIFRNGYPLTKEELALLVFARGFLSKPGLVLIDDLLNYLSKESLARILPLIQEHKKYSTFLIASFSPDVLKIADRVYALKDGQAIEKGKVKL